DQAIGRKDDPNFAGSEFVILESTVGPRDHEKEGPYYLHTFLAGAGSPPQTTISSGEPNPGGGPHSTSVGWYYAGLANYEVLVLDNCTPRVTTPLGAFYLLDSDCENAAENLKRHGIQVDVLESPLTLSGGAIQWFEATERKAASTYFEGRWRANSDARIPTWYGKWININSAQTFPAGTYVVSTAQPLGMLAAILLEPGSNDGLFNWNFYQEVYDQNPLAVNFFDNRLDAKAGMVRANYPSVVTTGISGTYYFPIFKIEKFIDELK
ncbi:MAG: hypothetical protein FWG43_04175, partial [Clostridiales bacterium]|nr:hypothetical protein [Clostridiales bacterium]